MKLLFDGDIYAYRAAVRSEHVVDWGNDLWTLWANLEEAWSHFESAILHDLELLGGDQRNLVVCLSDPHANWRKTENPDYKSNRKGTRKPVCYRPLIERIHARYPCLTMPHLEADDVLGIQGTSRPSDTVVVSVDKDMLTLPATVFNPDKDEEPRRRTQEEADLAFWTQALTGDPTDGYPGCPGIGPVTAKKILDKVDITCEEEVWTEVVRTYEKKKSTYDAAVLNARMARICRQGDWDAIKKEMVWNPPTT